MFIFGTARSQVNQTEACFSTEQVSNPISVYEEYLNCKTPISCIKNLSPSPQVKSRHLTLQSSIWKTYDEELGFLISVRSAGENSLFLRWDCALAQITQEHPTQKTSHEFLRTKNYCSFFVSGLHLSRICVEGRARHPVCIDLEGRLKPISFWDASILRPN